MNWNFAGKTIAVIGDHNLDIDYVGSYPGLMSREHESLAVFESSPANVRYSGGGAANIVEMLADIQAKAIPVGALHMGSRDRSVRSNILWNRFQNKHISVEYMVHGLDTPAFIKHYRQSGMHVFRANIASEPMTEDVEGRLIEKIKLLDGMVDLVIVADYDETGNGVITMPVREAIRKHLSCPKIGLSRERADKLVGYDYLILNQTEIRKATRGRAIDGLGLHAAGLWDIVNPKNIIITLEGEGAVWYSETAEKVFLHESMVESVPLTGQIDTCGCGDAFVALFAACIARGDDVEQAIKAGNAAGRAQARKLCGAHNITIDEVKREWQELYQLTEAL